MEPFTGVPPCIRVRDLSIGFGSLAVIEALSLTVHSGEFISLLGPSGCGKSTLLRAMAGLIEAPAGTVEYAAGAPGGGSPALSVGFAFQKPLLLPWRTTLENVLLPVEIELGGDTVRHSDGRRARRILELVRLAGFEDAFPNQLSGGMQQRAAIARALMPDPELLLMDEPFGALDELTREALNEELLRIWWSRETRLKTIVMVTHSIAEAVALSDRIFVFGSRPMRKLEIVAVDLAHPRAPDSVEFAQVVGRVRALVRGASQG